VTFRDVPSRRPEGGRRAPPRGVDVKQPPAGPPPRGREPFPGSWGPGTLRDREVRGPGSGIRNPGSGRPAPPGAGEAPGALRTSPPRPPGVAFTSTPRGGALRPLREVLGPGVPGRPVSGSPEPSGRLPSQGGVQTHPPRGTGPRREGLM